MIPLLAGVLGGGESAYASDSVNVTLHKKKMDEFPNDSQINTGKEMTEFDRYEGLPGITFTAWDITEDFYDALDAFLTGNETDAEYNTKAKQIMDAFDLNAAPNGAPRYTKLEMNDAVDTVGVRFEGIDRIVMNGTTINEATFLSNATDTYTNTAAPFSGYAGFNIAMNLTGAAGPATANYLSQYAGQTMEIYYTVSFTDEHQLTATLTTNSQ